MPNQKMTVPQYEDLEADILFSLNEYYNWFVATLPEDDIYAIALFAHPLIGYLSFSAMTEQGLTQRANEYTKKASFENVALDDLIDLIRWSVSDSFRYRTDDKDFLTSVNDQLQRTRPYVHSLDPDSAEFEKHFKAMHKVLVNVLNRFCAKQFDTTDHPLLMIDFGDMSDEERLGFVQKCNSSSATRLFKESYEKGVQVWTSTRKMRKRLRSD